MEVIIYFVTFVYTCISVKVYAFAKINSESKLKPGSETPPRI